MLTVLFSFAMAAWLSTLHNLTGLREKARESQLAARARAARQADRFLVTPAIARAESDQLGENPTEVAPFTSDEMTKVQRYLFKKGRPAQHAEGRAEEEIRRVLSAQSYKAATNFRQSSSMLPGKVPIIDHLLVRMQSTPDWAKFLPALEALRYHRLPDIERLPHVKEITLGESTEGEVSQALEYLKAKVKDTEKKFGICLLGADTESISVLKGSHQSLTSAPPGTAHEFKVARPGDRAEALPVLMMVGHIGWQIHVHLPVACLLDNERGNILVITPGKLQNGVISFFKELKYLTGVGIGKDIEEFLQVIQALYGKDLSNRLHPTIPSAR
jgi:hypothetical protein